MTGKYDNLNLLYKISHFNDVSVQLIGEVDKIAEYDSFFFIN